nr:hypothetical protein [Tanacetum cinerariifolium]
MMPSKLNMHSSKRSNTMGYQKSPTSSSNNYKKNIGVGGPPSSVLNVYGKEMIGYLFKLMVFENFTRL